MKVIMLAIVDAEDDISVAISKGADSYVIQCNEPVYLLSAILDFCADQRNFPLNIQQGVARGEIAHNKLEALTTREMEIVEFVKQGLSNKFIAYKLNLSENTVRNHIRNIMEKLSLKNRVQLATMALKEDWRRNSLVAPLDRMASLAPCI